MFRHMRDKKLQNNQHGIVSIVVTIVLMLVITLIVLSFSRISRREQRSELDRQLSTQAFYAAESGVNDARKVIVGWMNSPLPAERAKLNTDYLNDCSSFTTAGSLANPGVLPGSGVASYTCLFVDPSPPEIVYNKSDSQHIVPIKDKNGAPINSIEIYWDSDNGGNAFGGCPFATNPVVWPGGCDAPLMRVEIVDAGSLNTSKSFFIYPSTSSGGTVGFGSLTGTKAQAKCNGLPTDPNKCKIIFNGLGGSEYILRVKPVYGSAAITIKANNGAAEIIGAQALIDVTGKASDVVRRIQVRVKSNDLIGTVPQFGIEGTDKVCKQFSINGTNATDVGGCWATPVPD